MPFESWINGWLVDWGDGSAPQFVPTDAARARHRYAAVGTYTVSATANNDDGSFSNNLIVVRVADITAPTISHDLPATFGRRGAEPLVFSITYTDDIAMADVAPDPITVVGPNGFSAVAQVITTGGSGNTRVVKYALAAPGGAWDEADNGQYDVYLREGGAADAAGNTVPAGLVAGVRVNVTDAPPGTTIDNPIDLGVLPPKGRKVLRDLLDPGKPQLYYKVTLAAPMRLCVGLTGLRGNADLELLNTDGPRVALSARPGRRGEKINLVLPARTYLVKVTLNASPTTPFKLSILGKVPSRRALAAALLVPS